jgi:O-antigen/teichoic acid export membrane protein
MIVREVPEYLLSKATHKNKVLWTTANIIALISSLVLIFGIVLFSATNLIEATYKPYLILALIAVPFIGQSLIVEAFLRGHHYPLIGQTSHLFMRPYSFLVISLAVFLFLGFDEGTVSAIIISLIISSILSFCVINVIFFRKTKPMFCIVRVSDISSVLKNASYLSVNSLLIAAGPLFPVLFLGFLSTEFEIGMFLVANQITLLTSLGLMVVNKQHAAKLAHAFSVQDIQFMKTLSYTACQFAFFIAAAIGIPILLLNKHIIVTIFGVDYTPATGALIFLMIAQLINAFFGSVGVLMITLRLDRQLLICQVIAYLASWIVFAFAIPLYGAVGAAVGQLVGITVSNILLFFIVMNKSGILSVPLRLRAVGS